MPFPSSGPSTQPLRPADFAELAGPGPLGTVLTCVLLGLACALVGLLLTAARSAWRTSRARLEIVEEDPEAAPEEAPEAAQGTAPGAPAATRPPLRVRVRGNAAFLRLPKLLDQLAEVPADRAVKLDTSGLRHMDHACRAALRSWTVSREIAMRGGVQGGLRSRVRGVLPPGPADGR